MANKARGVEGAVVLVAVGDISLGDSAQDVGAGVHARFERLLDTNPLYPFEHIGPLVAGADMVFGNLETVLSHHGLARWKRSSVEMRGHPDTTARLVSAGFTVLNVANNHMMQHGMRPFQETVESLSREGIATVGLSDDAHQACVPRVITVNGLTVTLLGFAFERDKYARGPVGYAFGPDCDIASQVEVAKRRTDLVICSLHWGVEFVQHPTAEEETLARQVVDAGADVVLGHHPHVVRRVERYGRGVIAYSLGNFVFDMLWNPSLRTGLVFRVFLSKNGVEGYETDFSWIGDDFQPTRLTGEKRLDASRMFEELETSPKWATDPGEYRRRYEARIAENRYESYRHFLRRINKRPPLYTMQTLLTTAHRKLTAVFSGHKA